MDTGWQKKNELRMVFDQNGNMTEWIYNIYRSSAGMIVPYEHDSLFYNSSNILIREDWNICTTSGFWYKQESWIYDDSGNLLSYCFSDYDWTTNQLSYGTKDLHTYDLNNKETELINQQYFSSTTEWKNIDRETRTWTDTLINSINHYTWDGNEWLSTERDTFFYVDNICTEMLEEMFENNIWYNYLKTFYTYTTEGKVSKTMSYVWNVNSQDWEDFYRTFYTYYSSGLLSEIKTQFYSVFGYWSNTDKENYEYDTQNRLTNDCTYDWTQEGWQKNIELHKAFDNSGKLTEEFERHYYSLIEYSHRNLYSYDQNNLLAEEIVQYWNVSDTNWRNSYKEDNYYSPFLIGINETSGNTCTCTFSNPLKNGDVISCNSLKAGEIYDLILYSLSGQIVFRQSFTSGEQIRVNKSLTTGLYLMVISDNSGIVYSGKTLFSR